MLFRTCKTNILFFIISGTVLVYIRGYDATVDNVLCGVGAGDGAPGAVGVGAGQRQSSRLSLSRDELHHDHRSCRW